MIIYEQDCDPSLAENRQLPYNSYLVEYVLDGVTRYDIVITNKRMEIFDWYWDHYRNDLKRFTQTEGRINPKLWDNPKKGKKK